VLALASQRSVSHSLMTPSVDLAGLHALTGATATSGFLASWVARLTASEHHTLLGQAELVPPGANGIIILPYFAGERTPLYDPFARGVIAGLTLHHGPADLYRAALESAAFAIRHNVEAIVDAAVPLERLVAVGGGTGDERLLWPRIVSAVLGRSQWLTRERVGAAFGDAVLAATAVGADVGIEQWNPVVDEVVPDPEWVARYAERWPLYVQLHEETIETSHALAHLEDSPTAQGVGMAPFGTIRR
jgi:xylulokinase